MKDNFLKLTIKKIYLRPGTIHRVQIGPLQGMLFRVNEITGLSPWYSGNERKHQKMFRKLINRNDTAIDIGANWGLHTLYLSRLVGPGGLVVSIEPFQPAFAELEWHTKVNNCKNTRLYSVAISDVDGRATFITGDSAKTGRLAERALNFTIQNNSNLVVTRSLDSIISELGIKKLKLVKIDVEGSEGKVLSGALKTVKQFKPYLVIELHSPEQDVFVAKMMSDFGYCIKRLWGPPILRIDRGWPDPYGVWGSILAFPKDNLKGLV